MATNTTKTKTAAASKPASKKTTAKANTPAPKRAAAAVKRTVKRAAPIAAKPFENVDFKTAAFGAGAGALLGTLVTKLVFFR